jgi:hypothetical protein
MKLTLGDIPVEDIRTIRTRCANYDGVRNIVEVVDRHQAWIAFDHDEVNTVADLGKVRQTVTVRVRLVDILIIESLKGEPEKVEEPF